MAQASKITEELRNADWETFYQLSPMREGLLNWYTFRAESGILEISSGYGGLTGVLLRQNAKITVLESSKHRAGCITERYGSADNLTVRVGTPDTLSQSEKYDYIVVEGALNTADEVKELLSRLCPFLAPDGRLLFVCNNRLGMKYWCGVPDVKSGIPFIGIREADRAGRVTRRELMDLLEENQDIIDWQIYYPFPDERLPQAIYTDQYLPKKSIRDRVISYYPEEEQKSLFCLEDEISDALIANEVLPVFANAFLVECSKSQFVKDVSFAAVSTDRGWRHGFATIITGHGTVLKKILHPEGRAALEQIYRNQQKLRQRKIQCVDYSLLGDAIEMPYISGLTMIDYLKELFQRDKGQVEKLFDLLYQDILASSESVDFDSCALCDAELNRENAGVILEKAYIDMIPYNCFYQQGKIIFYDQEFVKEGYPAKYVLFRALRYTYVYVKEADQIIPLDYFKEKYALTQIWNVFEREEARFIEDNRNYDQYASFYRWADVKAKEPEVDNAVRPVQGNSKYGFRKKSYDIELYKRDYKLNAVKAVQIRLLREFARVCEENDLMYCACYGTLLGAVRHKGYVPWDDDLDLMMPRRDYDRLVAIAGDVFKNPFFLQTAENDEGCFYGGYGKLRDGSTAGIESRNEGHACHQGIWIDILPLDDVLADEEERKVQASRIQYYQMLLLKKTYPEKRRFWNMPPEEEEFYARASQMFSRDELCRELHDTLTCYGTDISDKVAILSRYSGEREPIVYDRKDFEFVVWGTFEGVRIPLPVGYENCLKKDYGEDYLLYPGPEERRPHHVAIFDTKKSYIDYLP